ncbi:MULTISPECIES: YceI family protein [Alphaproteobacteria]|uniref:Polyisoprenoid-binding protein n=2 Tax=Alphaproteobacteria TaxID=28211 RepID=A0A512HFP0_9HYPH|nr:MULTISPECIES: YceI family protein [Alphaproteobacteria]GEO84265.1 polyisoprenoid-binding protein [Ciceribacter naphthalenivorans]GLR24801.1 polyisoprenoid-binding protein [Ciceribacter naphthalenivorans]GLT07657.1 polyisoprenoid-binding protein [Sphingomonas psychrolutea]
MYRFALILPLVIQAPAVAAQSVKPAPSGSYVTDPTHTSLTWRVSHFGLSNYTARFAAVSASLDWNAEQPAKSRLSVAIDPASVRTDFPFAEAEDFDKKIGTAPEFLAAKPIAFEAKGITLTGDNTGTIKGDLTFRGETHPVTLDVRFNDSFAEHPMDKLPRLGFSATGTVRRTDWGLDFAVPALGEDVQLMVETEFVPVKR